MTSSADALIAATSERPWHYVAWINMRAKRAILSWKS